MHEKAEFAKLLQEARQRQGLSQSQAAKKWGVPLFTLQSWEQARRMPGGATLLRLLPLLQPKGRRR